MTEFAGWEMPLYYSGIVDEVASVRTSAGIFDLTHMGELIISGTKALELIQYVTTNDASTLDVGQAQYSLFCTEDGGIVDDLVVYRLGSDEYMLVVNASNIATDFDWIRAHNKTEAPIENRSAETGMIAVQGPESQKILQPIIDFNLRDLGRFRIRRGRVGGVNAWIARTGYTGEDGFEIYCDAADTVTLWKVVSESGKPFGMKPIGLGARDILRLEVAYPLYENELTKETTPVDARLLWVVKLNKDDFVGKQAILKAKKEGPKQLLIGLEATERCVPRHGYTVLNGSEAIGCVTSGSFSPTLEKGVALAYVSPHYAEPGTDLSIDIRGKSCGCRVVKTPFYRSQRIPSGLAIV